MKNLYISDLDGTLLNKTGYLSTYSQQALHSLLQAGVHFTVASARSLITIRERLGELPFTLPIIHMNGGWITPYQTYDHEYHFITIPQATVEAIVAIFMQANVVFLASGRYLSDQRPFCSVPPRARRNVPIEKFIAERAAHNDPRLITEDFSAHVTQRQTISFTLIEVPQKGHAVIQKIKKNNLNAHLAIYPMGEGYVDGKLYEWTTLQHHSATKGNGARLVSKMLAISPKNLTVFGDNTNDLALFEMARQHGGTAIAPENAIPALKALATKIIPHHHHDSVIRYVLAKEACNITATPSIFPP